MFFKLVKSKILLFFFFIYICLNFHFGGLKQLEIVNVFLELALLEKSLDIVNVCLILFGSFNEVLKMSQKRLGFCLMILQIFISFPTV